MPSFTRESGGTLHVAVRGVNRIGKVYTNHKRLTESEGFPPPVRGCGRRWDPVAVDAWLDSLLAPSVKIESPLERDRRKLEARLLEPAPR